MFMIHRNKTEIKPLYISINLVYFTLKQMESIKITSSAPSPVVSVQTQTKPFNIYTIDNYIKVYPPSETDDSE